MVDDDTARPSVAVRAAVGAVATTTAAVIPVFLVGGLAVQISGELGFSPAGLGVVVALYFAVGAVCAVPAGWLVERYGDRWTSRAGVLLAALCMLAVALLAHSFLTLTLIVMASAAANSLGQLSSNLSLARQVPTHRQGLSFGVKQSAIPIATLLAGAAVPTVALTVGWRWAFVVVAALALLVLPLAPDGPRPPPRTPGVDPSTERATVALVIVAAGGMLSAGSASALGIFLVDSAVAQHIDAGVAGTVLTVGSLVGAAARIGGGWLADRRDGHHLVVVAALLGVGAFGLALLALPGVPVLVAGTVLGFGLGWSWPGEARVPHLEGVAHRAPGVSGGQCAAVEAFVVPGGQRGGGLAVAGQRGQERGQHVRLEAHRRRQLPEDRPELGPQREQPGGEEVGQQRLRFAQLLHVRDEPGPLDREHEVARRPGVPGPVAVRALQRVEGTVQFHRAQPARQVLQLAPVRQPRRVELAPPGRVHPPRRADPNVAHAPSLTGGLIRISSVTAGPVDQRAAMQGRGCL